MRLLFLALPLILQIPGNLKPPAKESLAFHAHASGDQIYTCDGAKWAFTAPDAKLFDQGGNQIGTHFAGPTWKSADGSLVRARAVGNATPDPESIPWLLLTATDHEGAGVMKNITSIQRLNTKGGKAPETGCDTAHQGVKKGVPYTADYYFFTIRQAP